MAFTGFNRHPNLEGTHATLSASTYHWINYSDEKMAEWYSNRRAAELGTARHSLAHMLITLGEKLPPNSKTLNMYVNDAIGYGMQSEQLLVASRNAYGTADAIKFSDNLLRIHDLKTGIHPGSEHQLEIYAAFFCIEYKIKPMSIDYELALYQNDEIVRFDTDPEFILHIISRIADFDRIIESAREGA